MKLKTFLLTIFLGFAGCYFSYAQPVIPTPLKNSILTYKPIEPKTTIELIKALSTEKQGITIQYFDGLGRPEQTVSVKSTFDLKDLVQPVEYDEFGRESYKYLPYEAQSGTSGAFRDEDTWTIKQPEFYNTLYTGEGGYAKSFTEYENSPLNRVLWQRGPGKDWADNNKVASFNYGTNVANDVRYYTVTTDNTLKFNGYYDVGTLTLLETTDEDNRVTQEWKDLVGQIILKRSYTGLNKTGEVVETYYVYDDMGRLRYVVPPLASAEHKDGQEIECITSTITLTSPDQYTNSFIAEDGSSIKLSPGFTFNAQTAGKSLSLKATSGLMFRYDYDERGRVTMKKIPGASPVYMVYDLLDRLVLEQDGELRKVTPNSQWIAHTYDVFGRELKSGLVVLSGVANTQEDAQTWFNSNPNALDGLITSGILLAQNWYDSYDELPSGFQGFGFTSNSSYYPSSFSNRTRGLLVAQEVRVLNPESGKPNTLKSKTYYDKKGRVIQTVSQLYDGGYITQEYLHNFIDLVIHERTRFSGGDLNDFSLERWYSYDHGGRVTLIMQRTYQNDWVYVANNQYDALNGLITQKLGVDGTTFVQEMNYRFNIRGWLTDINDVDYPGTDFFSLNLNYQKPADEVCDPISLNWTHLYGGNITRQKWTYRDQSEDINKQMVYLYKYDGLNRLLNADSYRKQVMVWPDDSYGTQYSYDLNGNILNLKRNGVVNETTSQIDNLTYLYDGNRLQSVIDNTGKSEGYNDINKVADFTYNSNGSMGTDADKGITVTYNTLNLPQKVKETSGNLSVNYVYTATGQKLATLYLNSTTLVGGNRYIGPVVRRFDSNTSTWVNDYIPTAEGRLMYSSGSWIPEYFLKDHLGNVRSIVKRSTSYSTTNGWATQVWQQNYYPFGMTLGQPFVGETNKLGYNGKETQDYALNSKSLEWLDYGWRNYNPALCRLITIDPLGDVFDNVSSYSYAINNPLNYIDFEGLIPYPFKRLYFGFRAIFGDRVGAPRYNNDGTLRKTSHQGTDWNYKFNPEWGDGNDDEGSTIYSTHDGKVTKVWTKLGGAGGYGIQITSLKGTVQTTYFHFKNKPKFKVGDKVREGQKIGLMGRTGITKNQYRSHGHYELRYNKGSGLEVIDPFKNIDHPYDGVGIPIDPQTLLKSDEIFSNSKGLPFTLYFAPKNLVQMYNSNSFLSSWWSNFYKKPDNNSVCPY